MTPDFTPAEIEALTAQYQRATRLFMETVLHPMLRDAIFETTGRRLSIAEVAQLAEDMQRLNPAVFAEAVPLSAIARYMQRENGIVPPGDTP